MSEPITWGYTKSWAEQNHVPDDAVMRGDGEPVVELNTGTDDGTNVNYFSVDVEES